MARPLDSKEVVTFEELLILRGGGEGEQAGVVELMSDFFL
jgi:hypothetical protein